MQEICGNSSVVEHHVANVRVASSNLVSRSTKKRYKFTLNYRPDIIISNENSGIGEKNISWKAGEIIYKVGD